MVKYIGDAVLSVFDSSDAALRSALQVQERFADLGIDECGLRVGVHLGEEHRTELRDGTSDGN